MFIFHFKIPRKKYIQKHDIQENYKEIENHNNSTNYFLMSMEKPSAHRFYIHFFYRVNITEKYRKENEKTKKN